MIALLKFLLFFANFVMTKMSQAEQRKVAEDAIIREAVTKLANKAAIAKEIDEASFGLHPDDVDRILRDQYRED